MYFQILPLKAFYILFLERRQCEVANYMCMIRRLWWSEANLTRAQGLHTVFKKHPWIFNDHQQSRPWFSPCLHLVLNQFWVNQSHVASQDKSLCRSDSMSLVWPLVIRFLGEGLRTIYITYYIRVILHVCSCKKGTTSQHIIDYCIKM